MTEHLNKVEAFNTHNPKADVDDWVKFYEKNEVWQLNKMKNHCNEAISIALQTR